MNKFSAIITGVSSGLGKELAFHLIDEGYFVVGISRRKSSDTRWQEKIDEKVASHILGDVSDPEIVAKAFDLAEANYNLKIVINCAGQGIFGPAGSYTKNDVEDVFKGNLIGTILFSEAAFNHLKSSGGTIVNIMSTAAHVARVGEAIYCASKWGARGYTESLRLEAKKTPVSIIAVYPGGMNTKFWENARGTDTNGGNFMNAKEVAEVIISSIASKKNCYVSDIIINRK